MKRRISLFVLAFVILVSGTFAFAQADKNNNKGQQKKASYFEDIDGHWAKDIINEMAEAGLISGNGNGKFNPNKHMSRREFAVLLHKAMNISINYIVAPDITQFFKDMTNKDWGASQIYDLASLGIITDKEKFRPNDSITREEMIHYVMNGIRHLDSSVTENMDIKDVLFSDEDEADPKFKNDIGKGLKLGFILGRGNNKFAPKGKSTRAEALVIIHRMMEYIKGEIKTVKVEPSFQLTDISLVVKLKIINRTGKDIVINHTSGQKIDFVLLDSKYKELYKWSEDKMFTMALTSTSIKAGEQIELSETISLATYREIIAKTDYIRVFITGTSPDFTINLRGYDVKIAGIISAATVDIVPQARYVNNNFKMSLTVRNNLDRSITINHNSGQMYDFVLLDANKTEIYRWSSGKMFPMALVNTVIEKGKNVEFSVELDSIAYRDILNRAVYMRAYIVGASADFSIIAQGYEVKLASTLNKVEVYPGFRYEDGKLKLSIVIINNTLNAITINHTSSQKYDFVLLDESRNHLYTWSSNILFAPAATSTIIPAGQRTEYTGEIDIASLGILISKTAYVKAYIKGTSDNFQINDKGYEVSLKQN